MKFAIITHVIHQKQDNQYFAYTPYVAEINIWAKHVDELIIVGSQELNNPSVIETPYRHNNISFFLVERINLLNFKNTIYALIKIPKTLYLIYKAMQQADHIHLRCPGNIGLLGCLVQIVFPHKTKTAKYAGNWDPKAKQPWSYRLQKWILKNTFLTRNMQVLVYGDWAGSTKNIKPFFTATYPASAIIPLVIKDIKKPLRFVFVGTLVQGKNPLYAIQLVVALSKKGYNVHLDLYGEGIERKSLEDYIQLHCLDKYVVLKGNQPKEILEIAYQNSHFALLPSASEGWPKAIAEAMFWGCIPIATAVSCVPFILDYGKRGILITVSLESDVQAIELLLKQQSQYDSIQLEAANWSRNYTLDAFEIAVKKLLHVCE